MGKARFCFFTPQNICLRGLNFAMGKPHLMAQSAFKGEHARKVIVVLSKRSAR